MKIFAVLSFILFSTFKLGAQTTMEEYLYVTKGYRETISSGLDLKKGYRLLDLHENKTTTPSDKGTVIRDLIFKGLYRDDETTPCAIMLIYKRSDVNSTPDYRYICIPHYKSNAEIWNLYFDEVKNFKEDAKLAILWGLGKSASFFAQNN